MAKLTDMMKKVLAEHSLGYVASIAAEGSPSLSPKATFVDVLARKGFRCKGPAVFHARGTEQFDACLAEFAKVRDQGLLDMFNGIVLIDLESASPLISPAYETGETEESLRAVFKDVYAKL